MSMVEVRVPNLDCEGCASKLRRALFKLKGVEEVEVEIEMQKITVRGYGLEERKVVKAIKRAGKAAEAWPFPGYSSHYTSFYKYPSYIVNHYYDTYSSTNYNNRHHNNNKQHHLISSTNTTAGGSPTNSLHTFFQTPSLYSLAVSSDHTIASLFSDDNPHACSIM
ncbi:heavy metal-associated isoprenylated plant protein 31 [Benincasa hispida]|uniref:heavy metal-associated isoprenylated plant protein 31 n=1 Tax=Benincasa hispida TaxID=102211 RepID=UPI0019010170|nr:heavy metal-associated isoprenylated plant protein 31 [Benincasa hispida]